MPTTQKVAPPASVEETLRSIAENTARWTDIAGVSLARTSGAENAKLGTGLTNAAALASASAEAEHVHPTQPTVEAEQTEAAFAISPEARHAHSAFDAPLGADARADVDVAPRVDAAVDVDAHADTKAEAEADAQTHAHNEAETHADADTKANVDTDANANAEPVVQWPIEPPVIQPPLTAAPAFAPVVAPASATDAPVTSFTPTVAVAPTSQPAAPVATPTPFQIFAARLQQSETSNNESPLNDAENAEDDATPFVAHAEYLANTDVENAQPAAQFSPRSHVAASENAAPAGNTATTHPAETEPVAQPPSTTPAPVAEVVIPKPLAPWETITDAAASSHAALSASESPVRSDAPSETSVPPHQVTPSPHIESPSEDAAPRAAETVDSPAPSGALRASESSTAHSAADVVADVQPTDVPSPASNVVRFPFAAQAGTTSPSASPVESAGPIESVESVESIESSEPAEPADPTPAAQRPPLRGHSPANGFEFRAPAASMVELPPLDLLAPADIDIEPVSEEKLIETGLLIEQRLQEFKVPVTVVGASAGPVITRFEVEPALGVRGSQIVGLMKDLSRGLGLTSIRVVETIPGKTCMGLELPNAKRQTIRLSEILEASVYQNSHSQLTLAMARTSPAIRWWPIWRRRRTCWSRAPQGRASRWRSTR